MRLLLLVLLVACTKDNDPVDTDTADSGFEPTGGLYGIQSGIAENDCGSWGASFNDSIDGTSLEITFPDSETARLHWVNALDCPRDQHQVDCSTAEPLVLDDYAPDNDARIMYEDQTLLGWDTETHATGSWEIDLSCEGTQCDLISTINEESYPCTIMMNWELSLEE